MIPLPGPVISVTPWPTPRAVLERREQRRAAKKRKRQKKRKR